MIVTVSTCGTSTLTNSTPYEDVKFLRDNANKSEKDYSPEETAHINAIISHKREVIAAASPEEVCKLSAELNGFITYYKNTTGLDEAKRDTHYLIHTDTMQGREATELIRLWGERNGIPMTLIQIDDLNTGSLEEFRLGINNLVEWCANTLPGYRLPGYRVIFNLVGGFKSLQGYMQTLGMFYADETVYIFETGGELLRIPKIPADFNVQAKQAVLDHLRKFRLMQRESLDRSECEGIPETLLEIIDGKCTLSTWGRLIFDEVGGEEYRTKLLDPISDRIQFTRQAKAVAEDLTRDQLMSVNKALDKLSRQIDNDEFLRSCNLRQLRQDRNMCEFNLWGAWRGFCHWEGQKLIIDEIKPGLHREN